MRRLSPQDRSSASWLRSRCRKSMPPCPARWPRGSLPGRQNLPPESRLAAYALRFNLVPEVAIAKRFHILRAHHGLIIRTVAVHKLADRDLPVQRESDFAGGRAVLHLALFLVVLHGVESVAHLVTPLVESRTRRDYFDERESLLLERFADRARQLPHMEGRPARHVDRARRLDQMRQIERRFKRAVGIG